MRLLYLLAASATAERVLRRLAPILAWIVVAFLLVSPFFTCFLLGRATAH